MTVRAKNRAIAAGAIVAVAVIIATILPMIASSDIDKHRDVNLVIRDMSFYLDGRGDPNPTLQFRAGERIRLTLRNEDAGMSHDFVVKNWNVQTKLIEGRGEDTIELEVPRQPGSDSYVCTPHPAKMRGAIVIE